MPTNIGLEISATAVRIAKVSTKGHHKNLIAFAESALPLGAVVDGAIVDKQAVITAIEQCLTVPRLKRGKFEKPLAVYLAVSGLRAISREIEAPNVPDAELDDAVRLQAMDVIPFPAEKTLISARRLSSTAYNAKNTDSAGQQIRVLLAAAHSDLVEPFIEVVVEAGLVPKGIDLASSALVRSLGDNVTSRSGPEAIVSVGADLTIVVVHDAGRPIFVRTIAEGGNSISKAIATSLDIPLTDADNIKKFVGRPDRHTPPVAVAAARDASARIITEIKNSIDYFSSTYSGTQIQRVLITGGGSRLVGFTERLSQALPIPVERASCLRTVQGEKIGQDTAPGSQLDDVAAIAIGLALPEPSGIKRLDLLPKDFSSAKRLKHTSKLFAEACLLVIIILAAIYGLRLLSIHNAENTLSQDRAKINQLNITIPKYNYIAQEETQMRKDSSIALPVVAEEVNWPSVIYYLAKEMPKTVAITSFTGTADYGAGGTAPAVTTTTTAPSGSITTTTLAASNGTVTTTLPPLPPVSDTPPALTEPIGVIQLQLKAPKGNSGYKTFYNWAYDTYKYGKFQYTSYQTISTSDTANSQTTWSASINILGSIKPSRYAEFNVLPQGKS